MQSVSSPSPISPDFSPASQGNRPTSVLDDSLTHALASLPQLRSPMDPQENICCCCGKQECSNTRSWLKLKTKLEEDLSKCAGRSQTKRILSGLLTLSIPEIGYALLQRHNAYVRSHEVCPDRSL